MKSFLAISIWFGCFLGSEGMPTPTGRALGLLGIILFIFLLLFRLYFARIRSLLGFRGIFLLRLFLLFLISFFCYCLRIDFLSRIGLYVSPLALFIFNVGSGGSGQALPLPSPSVPPSSPPWGDAEISFSMEPHPGLDFDLLRSWLDSFLPSPSRQQHWEKDDQDLTCGSCWNKL